MERKKVLGFIKRAYTTALDHGFHDVDRSDGHWMMLVMSEIGEMVEADRKKRRAVYDAVEYSEKHADETDDVYWNRYFERDVKDTLEDELADVCIRIFDFCGYRSLEPVMSSKGLIDMGDSFAEIFGDMSICEQCYALCNLVTDVTRFASPDEKQRALGSILSFAVSFARHHGIDLEWHIDRKMRYNENREVRHGKEY